MNTAGDYEAIKQHQKFRSPKRLISNKCVEISFAIKAIKIIHPVNACNKKWLTAAEKFEKQLTINCKILRFKI